MPKVKNVIRTTGLVVGTGLAAYGGIELGEYLGTYLPNTAMLPEITQGLSAFIAGTIGNEVSRTILSRRRLLTPEAHSICALNAFASVANESRNLSVDKSLEEISNNLVQVRINHDKRSFLGSGLLITSDGYVLTAHHVVENLLHNGSQARITTQEGRSHPISKKNVWYNKETDIAIIKASTPGGYSRPIRVKVDQNGVLRKGDEIRVLGFRDGQKYNTLGVITNPNFTWNKEDGSSVHDLFQTNAHGKQGQSGGVIANGAGELMGIVVCSAVKEKGDQMGLVGGARISNALKYINQIAARNSAKMFE